jgi:hypothetical protein
VAGVALHAVQTSAVHRDDGALHVYEIVLTQLLAILSPSQLLCHIAPDRPSEPNESGVMTRKVRACATPAARPESAKKGEVLSNEL